jgi:hypothetical protein
MEQIDSKRYKELLLSEPTSSIANTKMAKALDIALAARQFEIEMYLKRTTYFWTLLGAALAGYLAVQSIDPQKMDFKDKNFYSFMISIIGLVISLGWSMANKGSKYWHENWENHVMVLSKEIVGPIFNITLSRPDSDGFIHGVLAYFTRPGRYSVTKINILFSWFMLVIWIALLINSIHFLHPVSYISPRYVIVTIAGILAIVLIIFGGRSFSHDFEHIAEFRDSTINPPSQQS